ncbi:MAG: hypothetical protein RSE01_02625 [Akkermansia sp.]
MLDGWESLTIINSVRVIYVNTMLRSDFIEAPDNARVQIKSACEANDMIFPKKTSDYILNRKWKRNEVIQSIIEHIDSGYKIFIKSYNNPHSIPKYAYQGSLKHYAVSLKEAQNDLQNKTCYMEIKGRPKPLDVPFNLLMHRHDAIEIFPIT